MKLSLILITLIVITIWITYSFIKIQVKKSEEESIKYLEVNSSNIKDFHYIIIFGAKRNHNKPSNELRARIDFALKVWGYNTNAKFVITGGDKDPNDEQEVIFNYLIKHGVPMALMLKLENSNTTRNTINSLFLQHEKFQDSKFLAITSSYHAKRIEYESKKNKVVMSVSAPRNSPEVENIKVHEIRIMVEVFAILFYMLPMWLTRNVKTSHGTFRHAIPKYLIKAIRSRT